jgi:Tfp pilus assembly protein PilO
MSQPTGKVAVGSERIRAQLTRIHKARRRGVLGIAEIAGLSAGGLMLLAVLFGYFYFLLPAQSRLASLLLERDRLQQQLRVSQDDFRQGQDTKTTVEKITTSLQDFETLRLIAPGGGRMLLYEDLNQLMHKNGLRNTSGPSYTALEPLGSRSAEQAAAVAANSAATKWQSVYPGIAVNVTVEGPYQNVRHFVRDIESSKEFIIINAVELERATESNSQPVESGPKAAPGGGLVSLRLDLATYFQRSGRSNEQSSEQSPPEH